MVKKIIFLTLSLLVPALVATPIAWSQNPYGAARNSNLRQGRTLPTFGVGGYQAPPTGNYSGSLGRPGGGLQSAQTYPQTPRVRRPVISPYLNLNRPEGVVAGVPNYYSLVRPRVEAQKRYQQGVDDLRRYQQENAARQQEFYEQQNRDFEALNKRIDQNSARYDGRGSASRQTQYTRPMLRSTGHPTSFSVR